MFLPIEGQHLTETSAVRPRTLSIVIPTRDRPRLLSRCLAAVLMQECRWPIEVIVVNDGGCELLPDVGRDARVRVLGASGRGPAAARNAGIRAASGDIVLFTDDDALPKPGWADAAVSALECAGAALGVAGPVESSPVDPLYEHSVIGIEGNDYLTCNIAYRRAALLAVDGFDESFPHPHCEDRDLSYRVAELGPILFDPRMRVVHPVRSMTVWSLIRSARIIESEWLLHRKHPQTRPARWSLRWGPPIRLVRRWQRLLLREDVIRRDPRRALRLLLVAAGQLCFAFAVTLTRPRRPQHGSDLTQAATCNTTRRALRVAWVGPAPMPGGGVAGVAWLILDGLSSSGFQIDCYIAGIPDDVVPSLRELPGVRVIDVDTGWRWDRWYSRGRASKFASGLGSTALARRRIGSLLVDQHVFRPYDVIYQFSTIETFGLRRRASALPPIVMHPETHMAGELHWYKQERRLARQCEQLWRVLSVEAVLRLRASRQRGDIKLAASVVAISKQFGQSLVDDYGLNAATLTNVPNPIDLAAIQFDRDRPRTQPMVVAFVSRMSTRKGVDLVVGLSHRLVDLAGEVVIELAGEHTLWSDYRPLLTGLNPLTARYRGRLSREDLIAFLRTADLLIQPAKYEPFGLTVGEALASGVPIIATTAVGAAEEVSSDCCEIIPPDDIDALETAVRMMVARVQSDDTQGMRSAARREAERLFSPVDVSNRVAAALRAVALTNREASTDHRVG